jgi:hypothetical protein
MAVSYRQYCVVTRTVLDGRVTVGLHVVPMRCALLVAAALGMAASARAQNVAGAWTNKYMIGPRDSVIATVVITVSDDAKTWMMKFPDRPPIPVRVVSADGDSVVTDAGPYPSTKRVGQSVTLLHAVSHFKGDHMSGTFEAHYSGGLVVEGKTEATRTK